MSQSVFTRARVWLRPPRRLRPTRAGWSFFLLTFGVGFAALNTGNNLLYLVLSLMLAFLVLSGVLSELTLRGIHVRRRVPHEVFAERDARVALELHNAERRTIAFAVVVEDRISAPGAPDVPGGRVFALRLPPGATETRSYLLCADRRGPLEFHGFVVSTRFPFGLFSKSLVIGAPDQVLVYPAVDPITPHGEMRTISDAGESAVAAHAGDGSSVVGVREFVTGDDQRRIDWRTTLRAGRLSVRELEQERDADIEVALEGEVQPEREFERRVRHATSEVVAYLDAGLRVGLRTPSEAIRPDAGATHRARLLGHLARIEIGQANNAVRA